MEGRYITQLPWWLIISLNGFVRLRIFQVAVKLAEIFERKYKSNLKVQAANTERSIVNKIDSYLVTGFIGEMKKR